MQNFSIKELRHLLVNDDDFDKTKDYFFDWVSEHKSTAYKTPTKNKNMMEVLKLGLSRVRKREVTITNMRMHEVKGVNLLHGAAFVERDTFAFFYFSDLDWGMIISLGGKKGEAGMTRFRMLAQDKVEFDTSDQMN